MDGPQQPFTTSSSAATILLEQHEWNVVLAGLGELPLKVSKNVFDKIVQQLQQQRS